MKYEENGVVDDGFVEGGHIVHPTTVSPFNRIRQGEIVQIKRPSEYVLCFDPFEMLWLKRGMHSCLLNCMINHSLFSFCSLAHIDGIMKLCDNMKHPCYERIKFLPYDLWIGF